MKNFTNLARLTACIVFLFLQICAHAEQLHGRVVGVSDGDSITVLDVNKQRHIIRLMGIDAPEKAQPFGQKSKESLSDLVFNKDVMVTWSKKDRYGRTLGKVSFEGLDVCLEQLNRGMAWHYKQYARDQTKEDRARYAAVEENSRIAKIGLWIDNEPTEPSEYRKRISKKYTLN